MARMIGIGLGNIKQSGERRFAQRLQSHLEDDYLVWYDVPVGKKRRYPDFIILHPQRGLLFIEVKDWKPAALKRINPTSCTIETPTGRQEVPHPLEQVRQCAYTAVNDLVRNPQLRQSEEKYSGKLICPYGWGVVFTNIARDQIQRAMPDDIRERLLPDHLVIYKDEMTESVDPEFFQSKLWDMFNVRFPNKLTLPQIDCIRWHMFPELRIGDSGQATLFPEDGFPEDGSEVELEEAIPDIIRIMDIQQEQLARSLGDGHRVIHGVAGSGKTLILGYRCIHLAQILHKPILVLCFNITLAAKLRGFISARGIHGQVQVYHFHDWCGQQLKTYHVGILPGEGEVYDRMVDSVIDGVDKGMIPRGQYGAVLIDEGHDFAPEWLRLVTQIIDPETNSLLLLYDDAQSIYRKHSALKFSLASVGIQAQGRTTILKLNYRNTREILEFAYNVVKDYFHSNGQADIPLIQPEAAGMSGPFPIVKTFNDLQTEVQYVAQCVSKWHEQGIPWKEIAILYPGGVAGKLMARALTEHGIPHLWLGSSKYKKSYSSDVDRITVLSIHSSKGLEFRTIVILDASFEREQVNSDSIDLEESMRLLYVGMTRARERLLISSHRNNTISSALNLEANPAARSCNVSV